MKTFKATVIETVQVRKIYWVDANDKNSAMAKFLSGETCDESTIREEGVTNREILFGLIEEVPENP